MTKLNALNETQEKFNNQLQKAIDKYGDEHVDIVVNEEADQVYGFYHSRHDSSPVTDTFSLTEMGGIEAVKQYEDQYEKLCVVDD